MNEPTEYECPFCCAWVKLENYKEHQVTHRNDPIPFEMPDTVEEFKRRFQPLGYYSDR